MIRYSRRKDTTRDPAPTLPSAQVQAHSGQSDGLQEVARQQGIGLGTQEGGPCGAGPFGFRVDPSVLADLPHGRRGDLYPQHVAGDSFATDYVRQVVDGFVRAYADGPR
jgi:hypothetical protein